ncbi:DEAD/DEAH box helicase [Asticcacaulis sp. EMRT-3]|uniref:DEAD/DEAH box helicase n=1 Tax=Asticcacaulis sp. EMRT-3 TaxID=3040349 RepID=UPI0024AFEA4F|nr:DEAD/DEAH box helicase [Asticcacaulis sp. EMRT-3]MDI7774808.1 DEAD/DEAH box helicase [Asticcacaulis sp. EMRT-3]
MTKFTELGLGAEVLRAVAETGYDTPTAIQEQAIPVALTGLDVLGIAQTGTGKTAAFTLPMIERLAAGRSRARMPRAIVLAPTRELADQVAEAFEKYAKYHKLNWALLIGGVSMADQVAKLDKGVDVLICTPGRLLDLFERSKVMLNGVQIMVVDEADRMLDMGFIPDIERIFKLTPPTRQTLFFSATMPPEITRLTEQFLKNPVRIEVSRPASTNENITQYVLRVPHRDARAKRIALRALIATLDIKNGIVFCNRKSDVDIVAKSLSKHGLDAAPIHGDLDQSLRMKTLDAFRKGDLKLLVASDVAARGLDIPDVGHVFNFDVPHHADDYVHRVGRTGRAGRSGEAYLLLSAADEKNYDKVVKLIKKDPAVLDLDVDYSALSDAPRPAVRESGKSRGSSSSRVRDRKEKPRAIVENTENPEKIQAPVEKISPATAATIQPEAVGKKPASRGKKQNKTTDKAEVDTPFGDHVPAFMMRSAPVKT